MPLKLDYLVGAAANPKKLFAAIVGGSKVCPVEGGAGCYCVAYACCSAPRNRALTHTSCTVKSLMFDQQRASDLHVGFSEAGTSKDKQLEQSTARDAPAKQGGWKRL
ncbi:unnamed protein product [Urochloa humidicola]